MIDCVLPSGSCLDDVYVESTSVACTDFRPSVIAPFPKSVSWSYLHLASLHFPTTDGIGQLTCVRRCSLCRCPCRCCVWALPSDTSAWLQRSWPATSCCPSTSSSRCWRRTGRTCVRSTSRARWAPSSAFTNSTLRRCDHFVAVAPAAARVVQRWIKCTFSNGYCCPCDIAAS